MSVTTILAPARPIGLAAPLRAACASLMGGAMVLAMLGHAMLNTSDPGWMLAGPLGWDPTQYQLAWRFFAQAPWQWPPGLNPDGGLELAGGIFHADAIPLLALPMKLLAPGMAQYWGPWLLACGVLQGFFGWVLTGHATSHPIARVLGAGILLLQPMLLSRMGGHLALGGHGLGLGHHAVEPREAGAQIHHLQCQQQAECQGGLGAGEPPPQRDHGQHQGQIQRRPGETLGGAQGGGSGLQPGGRLEERDGLAEQGGVVADRKAQHGQRCRQQRPMAPQRPRPAGTSRAQQQQAQPPQAEINIARFRMRLAGQVGQEAAPIATVKWPGEVEHHMAIARRPQPAEDAEKPR